MKAQQVSSLLKDAEELDWMQDHLECLAERDPTRSFCALAGTAAAEGDADRDGNSSEHSDFQAVPIGDAELKGSESGVSLPRER